MWSSRQPLFSVGMSLCPMILPLVGQKQCVCLWGGGGGGCSKRRLELSSLKLGSMVGPPPPCPGLRAVLLIDGKESGRSHFSLWLRTAVSLVVSVVECRIPPLTFLPSNCGLLIMASSQQLRHPSWMCNSLMTQLLTARAAFSGGPTSPAIRSPDNGFCFSSDLKGESLSPKKSP